MGIFDFENAESLLPENERRILSSATVKSLRKGEKVTLRILPGWATPQVWYRTFYRHYMFGLDSISVNRVKRPFLCAKRCFNEPCFFCDLSEALSSSQNANDQKLGDQIFPWSACLVNAYRIFTEEPGVEVYSLSNTTMKNLIAIWKEGINFMDPVHGCPIIFKPVPGTSFFMPEADTQRFGPVPEALVNQLHNLDDVLLKLKVNYIQVAAHFSPPVIKLVAAYYRTRGMNPPVDFSCLLTPVEYPASEVVLSPSGQQQGELHSAQASGSTDKPVPGVVQSQGPHQGTPYAGSQTPSFSPNTPEQILGESQGLNQKPPVSSPVQTPEVGTQAAPQGDSGSPPVVNQSPEFNFPVQQTENQPTQQAVAQQGEKSLIEAQMEDLEKVLDEVLK